MSLSHLILVWGFNHHFRIAFLRGGIKIHQFVVSAVFARSLQVIVPNDDISTLERSCGVKCIAIDSAHVEADDEKHFVLAWPDE